MEFGRDEKQTARYWIVVLPGNSQKIYKTFHEKHVAVGISFQSIFNVYIYT